VCTANTCRSPVAAALFAEWLRQANVPGKWRVASAGIQAQPGQAASIYSREVMDERGLDLSGHRSRSASELLPEADLVLGLARGHVEALAAGFPERASDIRRLAELAGDVQDVADPYGGPRQAYAAMAAQVAGLIDRAGPAIVKAARESARRGRKRNRPG
jgi:protein-tyrosine-phosphatase